MVKNSKDGAALSTGSSSLVVSDSDLLASVLDFDFADDGLGEVDASDFKMPILTFNVKGKDDAGQMRRIDQFFNTQTEQSFPELRCALIHLHKTRSFARFDNGKNQTIHYCGSNDRVEGRMRTQHPDLRDVPEGTVRACATCPDAQWQKSTDGSKNVRNCDEVSGVFAVLLDDQLRPTDPFLIRFKRTGLAPFQLHLNKHHLGKRALPNGKRANVPLFAFEVNARLEVSKNGNYATPVLTRGAVLPRETLQVLAEQAKYFAELGDIANDAAEKQESRHESGADVASGGSAPVSGSDFVA
jgi:hypothetical protein